MIAELKTTLVPYNKNRWEAAYQRILFPEPAEIQEKTLTVMKGRQEGRSLRLPRIHNNDPFSFHSLNLLLWMNHVAVNSCWMSRAVL